MSTKQKVLILGGGIAGTTLAVELINKGLHVTVISNDNLPSASRVAAGVYNPMVFKRLTLTPLAMNATLTATKFYKKLELESKQNVLAKIPMVRVFQSAGESNDFIGLTNNEKYTNHLEVFTGEIPNAIHAPFGCGKIISAGRLNVEIYLSACKKIIETNGAWKNETFNEEFLDREKENPRYNSEEFNYVVFTEGFLAHKSELWNFLKLKPVSGDIIDVEINELPQDVTWHTGVYATPLGGGKFRVGATYVHGNIEGLPTQKGLDELIEKLESAIKTQINILKHYAGVRPAAHDRNPYLGQHPTFKKLFVFNGLGAKGVMLAPLCAQILTKNIVENQPIFNEWSLLRLLR